MRFITEKKWEEKVFELRLYGCPKCGESEKKFVLPPHGYCVISMCSKCRWDILDDEFVPE